MKKIIILFALIVTNFGWAQQKDASLNQALSINQNGALKLAEQANLEAAKLNKQVSIAVLNNSGVVILLLKGDTVGPHNTEASRRKAYTALSTKTPSFILMKK
ncbi:heme-binding protein, partial [Riemerella anatipestifer]|nr:heme-binding protein [Riemerella anatipestifer]